MLGLFFLLAASTAFGLVPERRKDQFPKDFAYMVLPLPYSLPGLGEGVFMLGFVSNAFDTTTDLYGYKIFGGLKGQGFGLDEMPLGSENLMLNLGSESFNRGQINMYFSRGMESHQDEYHLVDFQDYASRYYNISLNMFDRRLELFYGGFAMRVKISAIRDHKANFLFKYDDPASMDDKSRHAGFNLDTTDDYYDPRKGLRLVVNRSFSFSSKNPDQPQFHTVNYMLNAYIHTGWSNTLALDYYRSMAVMEKQGTLDYNTVAASYCPTLDPGCLAYNEAMIDTDLRNNRY
ncbi:MAG: hypothetical protein OEZ59_05685, partial [Deltaproteobacteria bacterium]|nr:hypothetical protein [Deltaproteobacteria bacterium]